MSDRSVSPVDHAPDADQLDLDQIASDHGDHISVEDSDPQNNSVEREDEESLDIKPPQVHSSGSRKDKHKQKRKESKQKEKERKRDRDGGRIKTSSEKGKHKERGREREKDVKSWRDEPRERDRQKDESRDRERQKEESREWERERERQKEETRERERQREDAKERERIKEAAAWKRERERQEEDADREVKRREKSIRERERLERLERERHRLEREREREQREHRERLMREREKQEQENKSRRGGRAHERKRPIRQDADRRRDREKGDREKVSREKSRYDDHSDTRSRSPHGRKERYADKKDRNGQDRLGRAEPRSRDMRREPERDEAPKVEMQRTRDVHRSPILPPPHSDGEDHHIQEDVRVEPIRMDHPSDSDKYSSSDSESDSNSGSGSESAASESPHGRSPHLYKDGHVPSKFDEHEPDDIEEDEEEELEKDASDTESGHFSENEGEDGMMYALEVTPPASPVELAPELPVYYPAIHGCRNVEQFHCLNRIEEGTYGVVYRARDKQKDEIVALKRLKMEKEKEGFPITSLREINTILKSQHPNIVTVREIVVGSNMDKIYIVMDYLEHDLKGLMETMKEPFIIGEVKTLMIQLQRGVAHLHDNWIIHRDLKTSNLLLSHKGILKIGDFGLAREYGSPLKQYTPIVVTLWYRAPELLLGTKEYSTAIDLWSVGCIFAELLTRKPLFPGKSEIDELNRIFKELGTPTEKIWNNVGELPAMKKCTFAEYPYNQLRNRFGSHISDKGFDLMNRFLTYDPVRRITAEESLKHEWFKEGPLPVEPSMFPTWPAKSEQSRRTHGNSPKPPSGGKAFSKLLGDDDEHIQGFHLLTANKGAAACGAGFSLKF